MKIKVPQSAIDSGVLRVWLKRIPEAGGTVLARQLHPPRGQDPIELRSYLYGRGQGSGASEKAMLKFTLDSPPAAKAVLIESGEEMAIYLYDELLDELIPLEGDILKVE